MSQPSTPELPDIALQGEERAMLEQFLAYQRAVVVRKATGISSEDARQTLPPSTLSLAALIKHLACVEDWWAVCVFQGKEHSPPWRDAPWDDDPDWALNSAPGDDIGDLLALHRRAVDTSDAAYREADLEDLAVLARPDGEVASLRWILIHLIEEYARHAGHADLLREAIDGEVGD